MKGDGDDEDRKYHVAVCKLVDWKYTLGIQTNIPAERKEKSTELNCNLERIWNK